MGNKKKQRTNQYLNGFYRAKIGADLDERLARLNFTKMVERQAILIVKENQVDSLKV